MFPAQRGRNLSDGAEIASIVNLFVNIGILYLTCKLIDINTRNTNNSGRTVALLSEIKDNMKERNHPCSNPS